MRRRLEVGKQEKHAEVIRQVRSEPTADRLTPAVYGCL